MLRYFYDGLLIEQGGETGTLDFWVDGHPYQDFFVSSHAYTDACSASCSAVVSCVDLLQEFGSFSVDAAVAVENTGQAAFVDAVSVAASSGPGVNTHDTDNPTVHATASISITAVRSRLELERLVSSHITISSTDHLAAHDDTNVLANVFIGDFGHDNVTVSCLASVENTGTQVGYTVMIWGDDSNPYSNWDQSLWGNVAIIDDRPVHAIASVASTDQQIFNYNDVTVLTGFVVVTETDALAAVEDHSVQSSVSLANTHAVAGQVDQAVDSSVAVALTQQTLAALEAECASGATAQLECENHAARSDAPFAFAVAALAPSDALAAVANNEVGSSSSVTSTESAAFNDDTAVAATASTETASIQFAVDAINVSASATITETDAFAAQELDRSLSATASVNETDNAAFLDSSELSCSGQCTGSDGQDYHSHDTTVDCSSSLDNSFVLDLGERGRDVAVALTIEAIAPADFTNTQTTDASASLEPTDSAAFVENTGTGATFFAHVESENDQLHASDRTTVAAFAVVAITDVQYSIDNCSVQCTASLDSHAGFAEDCVVDCNGTPTATDARASFEDVSVNTAASIVSTDAQQHLENVSVTGVVVVTSTEFAAFIENASVSAAALTETTDQAAFVNDQTVVVLASVSGTDALSHSEDLEETASASVTETDRAAFLQGLEFVCSTSCTSTDLGYFVENQTAGADAIFENTATLAAANDQSVAVSASASATDALAHSEDVSVSASCALTSSMSSLGSEDCVVSASVTVEATHLAQRRDNVEIQFFGSTFLDPIDDGVFPDVLRALDDKILPAVVTINRVDTIEVFADLEISATAAVVTSLDRGRFVDFENPVQIDSLVENFHLWAGFELGLPVAFLFVTVPTELQIFFVGADFSLPVFSTWQISRDHSLPVFSGLELEAVDLTLTYFTKSGILTDLTLPVAWSGREEQPYSPDPVKYNKPVRGIKIIQKEPGRARYVDLQRSGTRPLNIREED